MRGSTRWSVALVLVAGCRQAAPNPTTPTPVASTTVDAGATPTVDAGPEPTPKTAIEKVGTAVWKGDGWVRSLVVLGSEVIFSNGSSRMWRVPIAGGTPVRHNKGSYSGEGEADALLLTNGKLHWLESASNYSAVLGPDTTKPQMWTLLKFTTVVTGARRPLAVSASGEVFSTDGHNVFKGGKVFAKIADGPACGLAIDANHLYARTTFGPNSGNALKGGGVLLRIALADAAITVLSKDDYGPCPITLDEGRVYYLNYDVSPERKGEILSIPKAGGQPTTLAKDQVPYDIAVDASHVYWSGYQGALRRVPIAGGTVETLATGVGQGPIALDETSVYLGVGELQKDSNNFKGTIWRVPKKPPL